MKVCLSLNYKVHILHANINSNQILLGSITNNGHTSHMMIDPSTGGQMTLVPTLDGTGIYHILYKQNHDIFAFLSNSYNHNRHDMYICLQVLLSKL